MKRSWSAQKQEQERLRHCFSPTTGPMAAGYPAQPHLHPIESAAEQAGREDQSRATPMYALVSTNARQPESSSSVRNSSYVSKTLPSMPNRPTHPGVSRSFSNQSEQGVYSSHSETPLLNSFSPPIPTLSSVSIPLNPLQPTISAQSHTQSVQSLSSDTHPGFSITSHAHSHLISPTLENTSSSSRIRPPQNITLPRRPTSGSARALSNRLSGSSPLYSPIFPLVFQLALDLSLLRYHSLLARFHHLIYPLLYFAHIPVTLFLDYNVIYALTRIAVHPYAADARDSSAGYIAGQPRANLWWIALGFHALSTLVWLIGVVLIHDVYYSYIRRWNQGERTEPGTETLGLILIMRDRPSADNGCIPVCSCLQSDLHTVLRILLLLVGDGVMRVWSQADSAVCRWRLRLGAFNGIGTVPGSKRQGLTELCYHYMQSKSADRLVSRLVRC